MSGVEDPKLSKECQITSEDVERVRTACVKSQQTSYRGIDVLLTSEWPAGVSRSEKSVNFATFSFDSEKKSAIIPIKK